MKHCVRSVAALALLGATLTISADPVTLTIYSSRQEHLIQPVLDMYTEKMGVQFRLHTGKPGPLIERLSASEGEGDILLTVDAGNLWHATQRGLLQPLDSPVLQELIPQALRDSENHWFGFSKRVRTIAYNTRIVSPEQLSTYEALAEEEWKGHLCLRTSQKVYNQSLTAMMIAHHGEEKTEQITSGWVANLAMEPLSNDTKALRAVAGGQCGATLINTYYFGRLIREEPDLNLALFWPNQEDRGVHVNISGGGMLRSTQQPEATQAFLEWLAQDEAQRLFAELNQEFPANPTVPASAEVQAWGAFKEDQINLGEAGRLQAVAIELMDRVDWR